MKIKNLLLITLLGVMGCSSSKVSTSSSLSSNVSDSSIISSSETKYEIEYSVLVTNSSGEGLKGIQVQICDLVNDTCRMVRTNDNGLALMSGTPSSYSVHLLGLDPIYSYNSSLYTLTIENRDLTISLDDTILGYEGDGSAASPYQISKPGAYRMNITSKEEGCYYSFKGEEGTSYKIESASGEYDFYLASDKGVYDSNTNGSNFAYWFDSSLDFFIALETYEGYIPLPLSECFYISVC